MIQQPDHPNSQQISPDYVTGLLKRIDELEKEKSISTERWKYFWFYILILVIVIFNSLMASCEFEIGCFKFRGFKDWGGAILVLIPEVIFILIYGARRGIDHLSSLLDKFVSFRNPIP